MSHRIEKVNSLIQQELSQIIAREIESPDESLLTITEVETTADLKEAKIWMSIFPISQAGRILGQLKRRVGYLQGLLNQRLKMYNLPKIKFVLDAGEEKAAKIEKLLDSIRE